MNSQDIINAYLYILGRPPENDDVIKHHLNKSNSVEELRDKFINSSEFKDKVSKLLFPSIPNVDDFLPSHTRVYEEVECFAPPEHLKQMMHRTQLEWEEFGKSEPHWSVLTDDKFKNKNLQKNQEEFYSSGAHVLDIVISIFRNHNVNIKNINKCFELGCGVGRITIHLAKLFNETIAADISLPHLELCRSELKRRNVLSKVNLFHLTSTASLEKLDNYDFFCSFIVLQHNPPPIIAYTIKEVLNKLNREGIAIFQVPTYMKGYKFSSDEYLSNSKKLGMEMHCIPQSAVIKIASECGCDVLEIREDNWIGNRKNWISNTFILKKRNVT